METPLSQLVPELNHTTLLEQNFIQIIHEYIPDANVTLILQRNQINPELVEALNTTSVGMLMSCFDISLDESIKQNLHVLAESYQLTSDFKKEKLAALKNVSLENIGNISMITNATSLVFCRKLRNAIRENLDVVLEKESTDSIQNATVYKKSFQNLNISGGLLENYIVAKYSVDEGNLSRLKQMIKITILNTLAGANINLATEKSEKFNMVIGKHFNINPSFVKHEILRILDLQPFLVNAFDLSGIKNLPGFDENGTLKDILDKSMESSGVLSNLFSLPLVVAVRKVGLNVSNINRYSIAVVAAAGLGVSKTGDFVSSEWLKTQVTLPSNPKLLILFLLGKFWTSSAYKDVPVLELWSIILLDYAKLPLGVTADAISTAGRRSLEKNIGSIFDAVPFSAVKESVLDEDFNTMKFMTILQKYFGGQILSGVKMEAVVRYHLTRFTGQFLFADFGGADNLGSLKNKILTRKDSCKSVI